jgi:RNA polymerase sigma-70 factor (ECF subfamily)
MDQENQDMLSESQNRSAHHQDEFVELMAEYQGRLYGYILSLTGNPNSSNDILQETNMVLWRKSSEFEVGTNFKAWSFRIANFQVMAFQQKKYRDRHVYDESLFEDMTKEAEEIDEFYNARLKALEICLETLNDDDREILDLRYGQNKQVKELAVMMNKKSNSLTQIILRLRKKLMACIKNRTSQELKDA